MRPKSNVLTGYLLGALLAVVLTSAGYAAGSSVASGSIAPSRTTPTPLEGTELIEEAWAIVEREFVGELPDRESMDRGAARGLLRELDDAPTSLLAPEYAAIEREDASGYYVGIGATVQSTDAGYVAISVVFRGSPAEEVGLRSGDEIRSVDGDDIKGVGLHEAISRIRGPEGTKVELEVLRPASGESFPVTITRRSIEIPTVTYEMLEGNIAHIALSEFNGRAAAQLKAEIQKALDEGVVGLILDLRYNPGGYLQQAVEISDMFLDEGVVLIERGREVDEKEYTSKDGGLAIDIPTVVLVNKGSASASEIVAGALQARGRATLIGDVTFGKGSVQYAFDLTDGSQVRVTTAHWFTPDDRLIQGEGLVPDVLIADDPDTEEDEQLQVAIDQLLEEIN